MTKTRTLLDMTGDYSVDTYSHQIIAHFARCSNMLRVLPFLEKTLEASMFIVGGYLDCDISHIERHGDLRMEHILHKAKALALTIESQMIKGNNRDNDAGFDGLRYLIPDDQLLPVDGPMSVANLDQLLSMVDNPTHLIMSAKQRPKLAAAATDPKIGEFVSFAVDVFGRRVTLYKGIPIVVTHFDALGNHIIDYNEPTPSGARKGGMSVYAANLSEDGVVGLQLCPMEFSDLGRLPDLPVLRMSCEWVMSMEATHPRAAARMWGVTEKPVTL